MTPLEQLEVAFRETTTSITHLEVALAKFYNVAPNLFPKPLNQMGASEKLKTAQSIIRVFKLEDTELEKFNGR